MSAKPPYIVQPQRRASGWINCAPHEAQRWAVVHMRYFRARGRDGTAARVVASFPTAAEAQAAMEALSRAGRKSSRTLPALGGRWPRTDDSPPPIARGIGRNSRKDY